MYSTFTDFVEIDVSKLTTEMKVYLNNSWWNVTSVTKIEEGYNVDVEAKFKGRAGIFLKNSTKISVWCKGSFGHKHEWLLSNDSANSKGKSPDFPIGSDTGFGQGSM